MERGPGRRYGSYLAMLRGPRGWQDLYKVDEYSPETVDHAYE